MGRTMDWNQTKSIAEADLDAIVKKVSSPRAALGSLEKKITAEVAKIEAYLGSLDGRALDLPGLLDQADQKVAKIAAVVAKADNDGRPDLKQAAMGRLAKEEADRKALQDELDGLDQAQTTADEWLSKLQDKLVEVQTRANMLPPDPKPAAAPAEPAPAPAPAKAAASTPAKAAPAAPAASKDDDIDLASLDALVASAPKPAAPAPAAAAPKAAPAAKAAPAGKAAKGDALDDEFAALFAELNVDPNQVELPKKKTPPRIEVDDKIPDLVMVKDDELPEGEELPPLEVPKKGQVNAAAAAAAAKGAVAGAAKGAPAAAAKPAAASGPVKGGAAAPAKATATPPAKAAPAATPEEKKGSKAWLWWTTGLITLGGAGAAVAHFVFGVF